MTLATTPADAYLSDEILPSQDLNLIPIAKELGLNLHSLDFTFGRLILCRAVDLENVGRVRALLEAGAAPNREDPCAVSPLQLAMEFRQYNIVNLLIELGADPDLESPSSASARTLARRDGIAL